MSSHHTSFHYYQDQPGYVAFGGGGGGCGAASGCGGGGGGGGKGVEAADS